MSETTEFDRRIDAARRALHEAEDAKRAAERAVLQREIDSVLDAHSLLVAEATGLRRAILELHAPRPEEIGYYDTYASIACSACFTDNGYEKQHPCDTYKLAAGSS